MRKATKVNYTDLGVATDVLQAVHLFKRYGETVAVGGVNFTVRPGEVLGLLGSNGAGKSTTVRMLAGLVRPDAGRALVSGHDVTIDPIGAKANLGYLPETIVLYDRLSLREYLEFVGSMFGLGDDGLAARVVDQARKVGLERHLDQELGTYSKGMVQRAALASATIHVPKALIMDEPGAGLDPRFVRALKGWIRELAREAAVLVCTHVTSFAEDVSDRLGIMHEGSLLALGTLPELLAMTDAGDLEEAFVRLVGGT